MYARMWHVVDQRRVADPPATLWRVEHSGNQDSVFAARAIANFQDHGAFSEIKRHHLNWYNKTPTPFLSTFSSHGHALNWARQRVTQMHDPCVQVHEIDTTGLLVFGAGGDEFLVLDEIPLGNVTDTLSMRTPVWRVNRRRRAGGGYHPYQTSKPQSADSSTSSSGDWYDTSDSE